MTVTDEERREVAQELREDAANEKLREQVFVEEIIVGRIGETMYDECGNVREAEILTRLADLIDPDDSCFIEQINEIQMECSKCGEIYELMEVTMLEDSKLEYKGNYCRCCGRKVIKK